MNVRILALYDQPCPAMRGMRGKHWDIFCNVIDNFGDIGVCWRLARQLVAEHQRQVRLWVDDLASFRPLCPDLDPHLDIQVLRGVEVRRWTTPLPALATTDIADVVVEAFACELPESYLAVMAARPEQDRPVWINLEYLSAETWVGGCHGLASPHPRLPLKKHFFFPGFAPFTPNSGGLLREARLLEQRNAWQGDPAAAWARLGLPQAQPGEISISLFCYENPALPALLNAWTASAAPVRCLVPQGRALVQTAASLGEPPLRPGAAVRQGNLTLHALPFVRQEEYDHLLWTCDLNFVRGEDSFVRALWAARPLVWHIYPQAEDAHLPKLSAFLDLYCANLPPAEAAAIRAFWQAWNRSDHDNTCGREVSAAWPAFFRQLPQLSAHATRWSERLASQTDLASKLVFFCENLL